MSAPPKDAVGRTVSPQPQMSGGTVIVALHGAPTVPVQLEIGGEAFTLPHDSERARAAAAAAARRDPHTQASVSASPANELAFTFADCASRALGMSQEIQGLKNMLDQVQQMRADAERRLREESSKAARAAELESIVAALEKTNKELKDKVMELEFNLKKKDDEIEALRLEIDALKINLKEKDDEIEALRLEIDALKRGIQALRDEKAVLVARQIVIVFEDRCLSKLAQVPPWQGAELMCIAVAHKAYVLTVTGIFDPFLKHMTPENKSRYERYLERIFPQVSQDYQLYSGKLASLASSVKRDGGAAAHVADVASVEEATALLDAELEMDDEDWAKDDDGATLKSVLAVIDKDKPKGARILETARDTKKRMKGEGAARGSGRG